MEPQKTIIQFRSRTYEMVLEAGTISVSEQSQQGATFSIKKIVQQPGLTLEKAKRKVVKILMQRPDPGMTFSD